MQEGFQLVDGIDCQVVDRSWQHQQIIVIRRNGIGDHIQLCNIIAVVVQQRAQNLGSILVALCRAVDGVSVRSADKANSLRICIGNIHDGIGEGLFALECGDAFGQGNLSIIIILQLVLIHVKEVRQWEYLYPVTAANNDIIRTNRTAVLALIL